jgi:DNA-binding NtrC family response regulator
MIRGRTTVSRPRRRAARAPAAARLHVVAPRGLRAVVELGAGEHVVGRDAAATVRLEHETVSRRHLALAWDAAAGRHQARDLGSRNGTWIDGRPAPAPLVDGTVIRAGDVILVHEAGVVDEPESAVDRDALPGASAPMARLRALLERAAADAAPVLVVGETGTGKERVAAELHRLAGRPGPLVPVNCAALAPTLAESALFGHLRGAFTGATDEQPGLFRSAHQGTLFLDEIGELLPALQPKLLRAIELGEVAPVGSARATRVAVRVVAATSRDLAAAVEEGGFRRDLHARLSLWELALPPLRARRPDLLDWLDRLDRRCLAARGVEATPLALEPEAAEALLLAPWPANLRGLDRLVHELRARRRGDVGLDDLPAWLRDREPAAAPRAGVPTRAEFLEAHARLGGKVHALARHFGRERRQIYRWLEAYGLR